MKNLIKLTVAFLAALTLNAAPQSGGGSGENAPVSRLSRLSVGGSLPANARITLVPILCVPEGSLGRTEMLDNLFGDFDSTGILESLPFGTYPAHPSGYSVVQNQKVEWHNFTYAQTGNSFGGSPNPASPFNLETGYVVNWLLVVESLDGTDSIALSDIRFSFTSNDGVENSLGHTSQLWEKVYSMYARGYKAGVNVNSPVISGSGDQKVSKIALVLWSRLYNGAGTQAGLDEIRNYVLGFLNFSLTLEVDLMNGQSATASVGTNPTIVVVPPTPAVLSIVESGDNIVLSSTESGTLQVTTSLGGDWVDVGPIGPASPVTLPAGADQLFKVLGQ